MEEVGRYDIKRADGYVVDGKYFEDYKKALTHRKEYAIRQLFRGCTHINDVIEMLVNDSNRRNEVIQFLMEEGDDVV